jgi:hypothetical protein
MTAKGKAKEMVVKFMKIDSDSEMFDGFKMGLFYAQRCALIAVDEILYAISAPPIQNKGHALYDSQIDYWQQVKQEIENL